MNRFFKSSLILVLGLFLVSAAALAAPRVSSITTCESVVGDNWVPVNITESFSTQTPELHAVIYIEGAKPNTVVKCSWVSVDAIATPNYEIASKEMQCYKDGDATAHFSLTRPDNGWPIGNYKVDIYIDGQLASIKTFSIKGAAPNQTQQTAPQQQQQQQYQPPPQQQQQQYQPPPQQTQQPPQSTYGYSGTYQYSDQGVTLTIVFNHQPSGELTGFLSSNSGIQYQIEGMVEEGSAYGACYDNQGGVFFEAYLDGNQLYFAMIEPDANNMPNYDAMREFMFTKASSGQTPAPKQQQYKTPPTTQPKTNPQSGQTGQIGGGTGGAAQSQKSAETIQSATGRAGNTYRHPVGFTFWYPNTWTTNMLDGAIQLIPANAGKTAEGPTELYFLGGENIAGEGIMSPSDQQVISYIDERVKIFAPVLQYTGRATPIKMSQGQGAKLEWAGTGANGEEIVAESYVSFINDHAVTLTGIGYKKQVNSRENDLKQMFASFSFGQAQNDPALIGTWELLSTTAITNNSVWETDWSRAKMVAETSSHITFQSDGRWTRRDKRQMLVGAGDIWLEDNSDKSSNGTWNAGDGVLYMLWEDKSYNECQYKVEGSKLKLACGDQGEVWERR